MCIAETSRHPTPAFAQAFAVSIDPTALLPVERMEAAEFEVDSADALLAWAAEHAQEVRVVPSDQSRVLAQVPRSADTHSLLVVTPSHCSDSRSLLVVTPSHCSDSRSQYLGFTAADFFEGDESACYIETHGDSEYDCLSVDADQLRTGKSLSPVPHARLSFAPPGWNHRCPGLPSSSFAL